MVVQYKTQLYPGIIVFPEPLPERNPKKRICCNIENADGFKYCKKCGQIKPIDSFYNQKASQDGKMPWCSECSNKSAEEWKLKNPDYTRTPEAKKKHSAYFQKNKNWIEVRRKKQYQLLKIKALTHYSGGDYPHCIRCMIDDIDVLCLDHINGGGTQQRRETPRKDIYRILCSQNYPSGYQTLCANCNLKKEMELRRKDDSKSNDKTASWSYFF